MTLYSPALKFQMVLKALKTKDAEVGVVAKAKRAVDLSCIMSLADNFLTTVDSIACGTPVVGFAVGGIPDQVIEGCGQLVALSNTEALGHTIADLLTDDTKRKKMEELCRKQVEREYSLRLFIKRYLALYRELVGGTR